MKEYKRWISRNGEVKRTNIKDLSGTSFNERRQSDQRNLDDLIHYLEYRKSSGYSATRVSIEQEEYWALLLRKLLMEK